MSVPSCMFYRDGVAVKTHLRHVLNFGKEGRYKGKGKKGEGKKGEGKKKSILNLKMYVRPHAHSIATEKQYPCPNIFLHHIPSLAVRAYRPVPYTVAGLHALPPTSACSSSPSSSIFATASPIPPLSVISSIWNALARPTVASTNQGRIR